MVATKLDVKDSVSPAIQKMIERVRNLSEPLNQGAAAVSKLISDSFRRSASPGGDPWKPLAQATVDSRRKGSEKPLVDTGTLSGGAFARVDGNAIVFGDSVEYAGAHQFGFERTGTYVEPKRSASIGPRTSLGQRAKSARKGAKTRKGAKLFDGSTGRIGPQRQGRASRAGQSYKIVVPARPFLPIDGSGAFVKTGPAGEAYAKVGEYLRKWIIGK